MSLVQTLKKEADDFIHDVEKIFNNLGGDIELLKAKLQSRIDTLKNNVDDQARSHTAQTLSDAGKVIPHDDSAQKLSEANPAPAAPVTVVGSPDAVSAAVAADPSLVTKEEVAAEEIEDPLPMPANPAEDLPV